ncbi:helix-turn-helix transcriptional regulator [uncultured Roseobacter sp.]|uniref:helix-turn-helix transcriptional regulator n=1 Tax=uncultured Roseobacter sp. TaxID=114847 RepID=UPI0026258575|nr:helix-turn-helix transcriptional regulator [uncultured Roseobacter sp.]
MTPAPSTDVMALLGAAIDAIGTPDFPRLIGAVCQRACGADNIFITALFDGHSPAVLYGNHRQPAQKALLSVYLEAAYLLDPFVLRYQHARASEALCLGDVAPDDFGQSEYHAKFFKQMGLVDECAMLLALPGGAGLFISCGIEREDARADARALAPLLPVIDALARRHWTTLSPDNIDGTGRLSAHLNMALEQFGTSCLSPREREISLMILQGHSSKAIAQMLGNSPETIKVHRKRVYTKLNVSGQGELLSLFLEALQRMPAGAQGDPIRFLPDRPTP